MAPRVGLEPTAYRLTAGCSTIELPRKVRGHVLCVCPPTFVSGGVLLSRAVSRQVSSALKSLTSVFGMGTGVSSSLLPPDILKGRNPQNCIGKFLGQDLDLLVSLS